MIEVTPNIWIGNSQDEQQSKQSGMDCVLIVAHDMQPTSGWYEGIEYAQVGLIDGPGNGLATYHAAVLALAALARKGKTLVCCHDGGRSLAISIMYMYLMGEGPSWEEAITRIVNTGPPARSRPLGTKFPLALPHKIHKKAFSMMDWGMMKRVLDGGVSD